MNGSAAGLAAFGVHAAVPFLVPTATGFRGVSERSGWLLHGPSGWAEFSPFPEYDAGEAARWLRAAVDGAAGPPPAARRDRVPVNSTVPAVAPDVAAAMVLRAGCPTAKVKVAEPGQELSDDRARLAAVRAALGPGGRIRIDANGGWDVPTALLAIPALERSAGGLEYVEQPCSTLGEVVEVRRRVAAPIAVDESLRRDGIRDVAALREAADVLVLKVQPLGGSSQALAVAVDTGLPVVVSSALETSVGLAHGVLLAAALPALDHACGLGTALLLDGDVVPRPLLPEAGWLTTAAAAALVRGAPSPAPVSAAVRTLLERRLGDALAAMS